MEIITVDENHCVGCNACVRVCPVHANITRLKEDTTDEFITTIDPNACINCGECVKICRHNARNYHDHIDTFAEYFESKKEMILIAAPSIRTSFPDGTWKTLLSLLRMHGNCRIYDVGFGADICSYVYNKYMTEHPSKKIITQPCPAVVNYIQKYKPELLSYLSPVLSPAGCLSVWLKKYQHETAPIFMLSPCIAKTSEAEREGFYDYNVTFRNLAKYMDKHKADLNQLEDFEFDAKEGTIGRMYPMPSGLKQTMLMLNPSLVIRNTEGIQDLYPSLDRYEQTPDAKKPDILDVLNCRHGCNCGTALPEEETSLLEVEQVMNTIMEDSVSETAGGFLGIGKFKQFKEFEKTLRTEDFMTSYKDESIHRPSLTMQEYEEIFTQMHKNDPASHNLNCGACGYSQCRDMAYAIHYHLNVKENCFDYLKQRMKDEYSELQEKYNTLLVETGHEPIELPKKETQSQQTASQNITSAPMPYPNSAHYQNPVQYSSQGSNPLNPNPYPNPNQYPNVMPYPAPAPYPMQTPMVTPVQNPAPMPVQMPMPAPVQAPVQTLNQYAAMNPVQYQYGNSGQAPVQNPNPYAPQPNQYIPDPDKKF